ncbi:MAG: thioether cross-link-forming SCIFF peptide maturase [Oscillospiraceae bacterium]|nr:thioether cross-link-forming SCIFF peptide maturase [Oscillospiraceae bacterium]
MIHKYTLFGYNIVIDTESGAVHVLSEIAVKMTDYLDVMANRDGFTGFPDDCPMDIRYQFAKYESSDVKGAYAELCGLYKDGILFSKPYEIKLNYSDNFGESPVKALCLNIAHDCNMTCEYCFAGKGESTTPGRYGLEKKLMSEETGMNAIRFLMQNSGSRRNLEVDFFGGEPLLNFETVKNIVTTTRVLEKQFNKNVRFTLTTNGTLLDDEKIDFINGNISNIVLSLDGLPNTNDNMRKYDGGSGTYEDIVPMYQKLVEKRIKSGSPFKDYYVRGTFTRKNLNFAKDVIHMSDLGFKNVSVEPVVAEEDKDYSIRREDLPVIFKEYETLAREIIRRERKGQGTFNFFHFNIDLENGPCVYKRSKGCGSGSEYLAVTPEGDIYPCHQFVGNTKFVLGNINSRSANLDSANLILNRDLMKKFFHNNIIENEKCGNCWVKYFCGGGCAANNADFNCDIGEPYEIACELEKKRVECAIAIKAALNQ